MFYSVNKVNANDGERIVAYELFQIAKKLTSSQVLYMRAIYDIYRAGKRKAQITPSNQWLAFVGQRLGHNVIALLDRDDLALVGIGLLSPRMHGDNSGINEANAHLTQLGILFCQNIETYHLETSTKAPEMATDRRRFLALMALGGTVVVNAEKQALVREILDEILGLGPLESLLRDPTISDILVSLIAPTENWLTPTPIV